jgi:hypothetical protein
MENWLKQVVILFDFALPGQGVGFLKYFRVDFFQNGQELINLFFGESYRLKDAKGDGMAKFNQL